MKGRKLFYIGIVLIFFSSVSFAQSNFTMPSSSTDNDNERSIHLQSFYHGVNADVYFNETMWDEGYFYQVSYQFEYSELYDSTNEEGFMVITWTMGTSIYSNIHIVDIPGEKNGFFNFTATEPISSCALSFDDGYAYWLADDHEPRLNYLGSCAIVVEDIYDFQFNHYIFTDYAMYAIRNDVTFCPVLINQTDQGDWHTIFGSVNWNINKVAIFNNSQDTIIDQVNATPHYGFMMGHSGDWASSDQLLTNGTEIPGNRTVYTSPSGKMLIPDPFPHQFVYSLELESGNASAQSCIDIAFVLSSYFSTESEWSNLPGWAKFTIIGGSISLLGCSAFIAQFVIILLKKRKLRST